MSSALGTGGNSPLGETTADSGHHQQEQQDSQQQGTLQERLEAAMAHVETAPEQAVNELMQLQHAVAAASILSRNETLEDVSTSAIPMLLIEHYLAMAYIHLPMTTTTTTKGPTERFTNLQRACDLFCHFLQNLEKLEILSAEDRKQLEELMEMTSMYVNDNDEGNNGTAGGNNSLAAMPPPMNRDVKIARFKAKQAAEQERIKLQSLQARRSRLGIASTEEMDGYDEESLQRTLALRLLDSCKLEALDEWSNSIREVPMVKHMIKMTQQHSALDGRYNSNSNSRQAQTHGGSARSGPPPPPSGPLKVTHITQDAVTGQLQIRKQEIQSQVFRKGWNQPTMSLEELGEREMKEAIAREERQRQAEAHQKEQPRRYEYLAKDGLEDNTDLVDASAPLDRQWDDFKDENPRGMGNKRGDVGDRNF